MSKSSREGGRYSLQRRLFLRAGLMSPLAGILPRSIRGVQKIPENAPTTMPASARGRQNARLELMRVALGKRPADLVIQNGRLVDTATLEILPGTGIAVFGQRIAAIGDVKRCIGPKTKLIDAGGLHLVPGFVDAHYHCESSRLSATQHARVTLPMGLTAYFEGTHEITNAASGLPGVQYFIEEGRTLPQKIYPCVSSATPPSPVETTSGYIGYQEVVRSFQQWPESVRGIDEVMDLPRVLDGSERLHGVIQAAIDDHRRVEGHGSPPGEVLDAWIAAGISSSHSPRVPEAVEMLRRGLAIQLKVDRTVELIQGLLNLPLKDWRNVGLAVDDRPADELQEIGSLDHEVRRAIELGVPALVAYQMGTINNAQHWRVDGDHGVLAPGRYADVLLISDLEKVKIEKVIANGELVAEQGRLVKEIPIPGIPNYVRNRVILKRPLRASDFEIAAPPTRSEVTATVLKPRYFSRELGPVTKKLAVKNGLVQRDLSRGITKFAIIERYGRTGNIGISFWEMGFNQGAIAWTVNHDHHNLGVIGATDEEMAFAANRVAELQGGFVLAKDGKVLAELALPIAGLMTHEDPRSVAQKINALNRVANEFGPVASLAGRTTDLLTFINLTCDPWKYSLTDMGLFNLETQQKMPAVY
jgi:adenine deaminase